MKSMFFSTIKVALLIALRNMFSQRIKSMIIGSIILFGTFLIVVGSSLLDSIETSMTRSLTSSVTGHLQIYSSQAKDELAIFGSGFMASDDYGSLPNFHKIKQALYTLDNIESIVPMGIQLSMLTTGNDLDLAIDNLRQSLKEKGTIPSTEKEKILQIGNQMKEEYRFLAKISRNKKKISKNLAKIEKIILPDFWQQFQESKNSQEMALQFLESEVAPLLYEGNVYYMRFLGTDLHLFKEKFDRFYIKRGQMVPKGKKGLLFNQGFLDKWIKNKVARELDKLFNAVTKNGKKISKDPILQAKIKRNAKLYKKISFQISPDDADLIKKELQEFLKNKDLSLNQLIEKFLLVDDHTIKDRYHFFYKVIAPKIKLYFFNVGDTITLRTYTKSGYIKAANVKVYGTFSFKGIEKSDLAGAFNLTDLVTFRELFGKMSKEDLQELESIRLEVGVKDINRENAEDSLFGQDGQEESLISATDSIEFDEFVDFPDLSKNTASGQPIEEITYSQEEVEQGMFLNAAIILKDPNRLAETMEEINRINRKKQLGIQVIDWRKASGIVGQFITVVRIVLYTTIFIIFLVALIIINNSMIMATMERVTEIGTMRAIGAQARFVLLLFLLETIFLGLLAGGIGALLGWLLIFYFEQIGLPAVHNVLVFLFSGPRLYPTAEIRHIVLGIVTISLVSVVSTLYPAYLAAKIQPANALERKE